MIDDPIHPKSRIPEAARSKQRFPDDDPLLSDPVLSDPVLGEPVRDPYRSGSRFSSPGQILAGLVLVIAVVVGMGLLFGTDGGDERVSQTTEVQPPAQPDPAQSSQAPPAPAAGTATSTN